MVDLLIKLPSRSRSRLFKEKFDSCRRHLSGVINTKFIFSFDENDPTMNNDDIRSYLKDARKTIVPFMSKIEYYYDSSKNKIDACNRDIPSDDWKVILLMSDDMLVLKKNFDKIIYDDMMKHFPDTDGCLNYNTHDSAFKNGTMVLTVMGRKYYDRFNYLYYPGYESVYCDNEQTDVAIKLNKLVNINNRIISHEWHAVNDALRIQTENKEVRAKDKLLYDTRKAQGFNL